MSQSERDTSRLPSEQSSGKISTVGGQNQRSDMEKSGSVPATQTKTYTIRVINELNSVFASWKLEFEILSS